MSINQQQADREKAVHLRRLGKDTVSPLPSVATIEQILRAEDLTRPREEKTRIMYPRLSPQQTQQLYQVDHIPRYLLGTPNPDPLRGV